MSNHEEKPWWADPIAGSMYTELGNQRVCNVLMTLDNELTKCAQRFVEALSNIHEDHPEVRDTAVRDSLGEAVEDICMDFVLMMTTGEGLGDERMAEEQADNDASI